MQVFYFSGKSPFLPVYASILALKVHFCHLIVHCTVYASILFQREKSFSACICKYFRGKSPFLPVFANILARNVRFCLYMQVFQREKSVSACICKYFSGNSPFLSIFAGSFGLETAAGSYMFCTVHSVHFSTSLHYIEKNKLHFRKCLKTVLN